MPTNPFVYQPHPIQAHGLDAREGWFGRTQRPGGDIVLPPDGPDMPTLPPAPPNRMPQPYIPDPNPTAPDLPATLGPGETIVGSALDNSPMRGIASYNGPKLNTESALAGLKNSSSSANAANYAGLLPESEVMRLASRNPNEVAPGANQYWQSVLGGRRANSQALDNTQDIAQTNSAIQGLHPALQQGAENEAQRRSYPAQYQAQGIVGAAEKSGQLDLEKQHLINDLGLSAQEAAIFQALMNLRRGTTGIASKDTADQNLEQAIDPAIVAGLRSRHYLPAR